MNATYTTAADVVAMTNQLYFGLDKFLPYFDFVGDFQHLEAHSEALLRHAGLWEEFGASGWGPLGESAFFQRCADKGSISVLGWF